MPPKGAVDVPSWTTTQLALLDQELQTELQENTSLINNTTPTSLARAGLAITSLNVSSQRTGLGGKTVVELGPDPAVHTTGELPEHGIRVGDIVLLAEQPSGSARKKEVKELEAKGSRGVVVKVWKGGVSVALEKEDDEDEGLVAGLKRGWIVKLADDVTYKRFVIFLFLFYAFFSNFSSTAQCFWIHCSDVPSIHDKGIRNVGCREAALETTDNG